MSRKRWTAEEDELLRELYPTHGAKHVAAFLDGRHVKQIYARAKVLGIRRTFCRDFDLAALASFDKAEIGVGGTIAKLMQAAGLTIRQIAEASGYSRTVVSRWRSGDGISLRSAVDLCQTLGFDLVLRRRQS
jgi:hypothetical protein